jgi:hypothetical protein
MTKIDPSTQIGSYTNQSTPTTPATGQVTLFANNDEMKQIDDQGIVKSLVGSGGGGGGGSTPTTYELMRQTQFIII